jgi:hypothetical protein
MASTNDVIFPKSMADILANPVDICFGSMPATSTAPAAYLVIEGNAVTSNQQIETDLQHKPTHPLLATISLGSNHLDEPCRIHEKSKHTARQCRVLKKFCRPLIAAYRHRLNQEPSLDRLEFQVAHTTISPKYPGEEFETLDRQILAVSADVPPQDGETDE